jgi:hypothetical protein
LAPADAAPAIVEGADTAVHFQVDRVGESGCVDHRTDLGDLRFHRGDVRLPAESGIDRHHQYQIDEIEHVSDRRGRRRRVERHGRCSSEVVDVAQRTVQMCARLGVHDEA